MNKKMVAVTFTASIVGLIAAGVIIKFGLIVSLESAMKDTISRLKKTNSYHFNFKSTEKNDFSSLLNSPDESMLKNANIKTKISGEGDALISEPKAKYSINTEALMLKTDSETIIYGNEIFSKSSQFNLWQKSSTNDHIKTISFNALYLYISSFEMINAFDKNSLKKVGSENVNNKNTTIYAFKVNNNSYFSNLQKYFKNTKLKNYLKQSLQKSTIAIKLWIDNRSKLPAKQVIDVKKIKFEGPMAGGAEDLGWKDIKVTMSFSDYNKDLLINPPKDFKD